MGLAAYNGLYRNSGKEPYLCDASTAYLTCPDSAKKIFDYNPKAKIIAILRHPTDRAYSLYNWMTSNGYEWATTFEKALDLESYRSLKRDGGILMPQYYWNYMYRESGNYYLQLERYRRLFGENLLVLSFNDLAEDKNRFLLKVSNHLKINFHNHLISTENESKCSLYPPITYLTRRLSNLINRFMLYERIDDRDKLLKFTLRKARPPKMKESTRMALNKFYEAELTKIEQDYGINFSLKERENK